MGSHIVLWVLCKSKSTKTNQCLLSSSSSSIFSSTCLTTFIKQIISNWGKILKTRKRRIYIFWFFKTLVKFHSQQVCFDHAKKLQLHKNQIMQIELHDRLLFGVWNGEPSLNINNGRLIAIDLWAKASNCEQQITIKTHFEFKYSWVIKEFVLLNMIPNIYRWSGKRRCSCLYYATDLYEFEVRTECPEVRIEQSGSNSGDATISLRMVNKDTSRTCITLLCTFTH